MRTRGEPRGRVRGKGDGGETGAGEGVVGEKKWGLHEDPRLEFPSLGRGWEVSRQTVRVMGLGTKGGRKGGSP